MNKKSSCRNTEVGDGFLTVSVTGIDLLFSLLGASFAKLLWSCLLFQLHV
jgi:hypothetical protein